jgi:hypothetical protein
MDQRQIASSSYNKHFILANFGEARFGPPPNGFSATRDVPSVVYPSVARYREPRRCPEKVVSSIRSENFWTLTKEDQMNNISFQHREKRFKVGSQSLNSIKTLIPEWRSKSSADLSLCRSASPKKIALKVFQNFQYPPKVRPASLQNSLPPPGFLLQFTECKSRPLYSHNTKLWRA